MYIERVRARFEELRRYFPRKVVPCMQADIWSLERHSGLSLPTAYKEFLLWAGRGMGGCCKGTAFFYPDPRGLTEGALELLVDNDYTDLIPNDAFVFYMHQGYFFMFFNTSEGEDPPVYSYMDGSFVKLSFSSFSEFLLTTIEDRAKR